MAYSFVDVEKVKVLARDACRHGILACAQYIAESARGSMTGGGKIASRNYVSSSPGSPPGVQTGNLRRSIVARSTGDFSAVAGTRVKYGAFLEHGGIIRPRSSRFLAVPVSPEARRNSANGLGARAMPGLKLIVRRGGKSPLLAETGGAGLNVHYVLRRTVRVAARPWLRPALQRTRGSLQSVFVGSARRRLRASLLGVAA